jgi:hypothetical protein
MSRQEDDRNMEATGNPPPPQDPPPQAAPPPPPAPARTESDDDKASGLWRALGVVLGLALLFAGAVMIAVAVDLGDTPIGIAACQAEPGCTEYFDGTSTERTIQVVLAAISGALAGIAALVAFVFAATGRRGGLLLRLTGAAIAVGVLAIIFGQIT